MKTKSFYRWSCILLLGLPLVVGLGACDKQDKAPPPAEPQAGDRVIIPSNDVAEPSPFTIPLPDTETKPMTADKPPQAAEPAKPAVLKVPAFTQQAFPDDGLYLHFLATGESFYTEIKLEHGILSYTYFEDTQNRCEKWVKSSPCWTDTDLKTISAALPKEDLDNLYTLAKESGVLKLAKETLGGAKAGQRHYAQRLDVRINSKEKHLVYQSFPGATKKPEAFARIETALVEYARNLPH